MDSAAAYSMTLPDEGGARWPADCILAVRVRPISGATPRNVFRLHSISGTGSANVDWGDGTSETVTLPGSAYHSYSGTGPYVAVVTGDGTSDVRLSAGSSGSDAAPIDVLRITCPVPAAGFQYMPDVGTFVADGVRDWHKSASGWPSRVVVQGVSASLRFNASSFSATVFGAGLFEFYAPLVPGFTNIPNTGNVVYFRPPFAGCTNLMVLYLPSFVTIPFSCFVSPSARGVKVHVGKLTFINAQAFTNVHPSTGQAIVAGNPVAGCDAELFCENASSEIIALGFPFGADYLKCHCTDMTFDSLGYRFRESDGRRYDPANGQLVNDDFEYVDELGRIVKYHEGLARWIPCDEFGFYVDEDGIPYDPVTGFWIDRDRHVCDENGRKCDVFGTYVDYKFWNPLSETDPAVPKWVVEDGSGQQVDYMGDPSRWTVEYGPYRQYVVDRLGGKVSVRENVNLGNGSYEPGDPRRDMWMDGTWTEDGYLDYYDSNGFLRARERSYDDGGAVYSVVYDGGREWHLELYSSGEGA